MTCDICKSSDCSSAWNVNGAYVCRECYPANNESLFHVFHPGIPEWLKPEILGPRWQEMLPSIWPSKSPHTTVHWFPRSVERDIEWQVNWWGEYKHEGIRKPYSYRAWAQPWSRLIVIFMDETETPESASWILLHELGHVTQWRNPLSDKARDKQNRMNGLDRYDWENDAAHEADAEEQFVNKVATLHMGGIQYDRLWWRKRVDKFLAGESVND